MGDDSAILANTPCPLGSNCDRPYCQFEHSIDSSQQVQKLGSSTLEIEANKKPEPVIIQENENDDLDYMGYVATSSNSVPYGPYGAQVNDVSPFANMFSGFSATQSLYAPEDPVLQNPLHSGGSCAMPTYSAVYTPSYQQQSTVTQPSHSAYGAEIASSIDGPVYPPSRNIPPPVGNVPAHTTYLSSAEANAASFGAFHTPNIVAAPKSVQTQQQPVTYCQPSFQQTTSITDVKSSSMASQRKSPTIVQIAEEDDHYEPLKELSRKRDQESRGTALATSVPPRKKLATTTAVGVPAYVPTPIAELERQKQIEKEKEKQRIKPVARNRSPCADDFSMIDRPTLPVDLADDEILNPQKRANVSSAKPLKSVLKKGIKSESKIVKTDTTKSSEMKDSSSFSISSRILAPPKKIVSVTKLPSKKAEVKEMKADIIRPKKLTIGKDEPGTSGEEQKKSAKTSANDLTTSHKSASTSSNSSTSTSTAEASLAAVPIQKRFKGSSSIFSRSMPNNFAEDDKEKPGNEIVKKRVEKDRLKNKRDRLTHLNETAKVLADLDKKIAEQEQALQDMINGKTPKKEAVWHKKPEADKSSMQKSANQFDIETLFDDVDSTFDSNKQAIKEDSIVHQSEKKSLANKLSSKSDGLHVKTGSIKTTGSTSSEKQSSGIPPINRNIEPPRGKVAQRTISTKTTTTTVTKVTTILSTAKAHRHKPPSSVEQMKNRFAALDNSKSTINEKKSLYDFGFSKGEVRKAHVGTFTTSSSGRKLAPLDMYDKKIAYSLRIKYLQKIFDEFKKISNSEDDAIELATREEKAVLDKISTGSAYAAAIANSVKRIREAANGGTPGASGISHMNVLAGRQAGTFTIGVKGLSNSNSRISEADFYAKLAKKYLLTEAQLWENGYPRWSLDVAEGQPPVVEIQPHNPISIKYGYVDDSVLTRVCNRCGKEYRLTKDGEYTAADNTCIYHWGKAWKKRVNGALDSRYTCCDQDLNVKGCVIGDLHVTETKRASTLADFVETPRPFGVGDPRSRKVYAIDCEMVYSVWGPVLARVSIVDVLDELVLDEIVQPEHKVVDPNTRFSGLNMQQLKSAKCTFNEVRERVFELVNQDTILIGHSLESDLKAMRIVHKKIVDTSVVFPHRLGPPKKRALKTIACEILQKIIQEDVSGHDSKEDASACMKIMLHKVEKMD